MHVQFAYSSGAQHGIMVCLVETAGGRVPPQKPPTAGDGLRYCLEQLFEECNKAPCDCVSLFPACGDNISVRWDRLERCHVTVIDIDLVFPDQRKVIFCHTATAVAERQSYSCDFFCLGFHKAITRGENGMKDKKRLKGRLMPLTSL